MCKVWGVVTRKGGVGKTTTSTTMAYLLAKAGYKVALIDFDGQRHSTKLSGVMLPEKLPITIYEILSSLVMGEELPEIETYIIHTESGVDLIPANNRLDYFDKLMCNTDFAEYKLKEYVDTILMPVILWHHEGLYIILSGHNRVNAGKIAGLTKCLVIIKENLSYEDAVLIVTETNLRQRSFDDLSPSEKAYCLKQHYEAIKCQGKRNDLLNEIENLLNPSEIKENETLSENQKRLRSDEKLGEEYGLNRDNVAKYLRIATLVSPLLEMLDEKKISMKSAYDLSFVKEEFMQTMIADILVSGEVVLDTKKSALIHDYAKNKTLTEERIEQILKGEKTKKPKSTAPQPIKVKGNVISRFFTKQESKKEIEETIEKALELYFARMSEEKEQLVG